MYPTVAEIRKLLESEGVKGVATYCDKLAPNLKTPSVYRDLLSEAYAALMFVRSGFDVTMRESPDLQVDYSGCIMGVEVKRFHRKHQNNLDDQSMEREFTQYGNTVPTEGKEAWEQVREVAEKKSTQLLDGVPNVLTIESSSPNCIEDAEILFAASDLSANNSRGISGDIGKLNGFVFMSLEYNISQQRSVYFFEIKPATVTLPGELRLSLDAITDWRMG